MRFTMTDITNVPTQNSAVKNQSQVSGLSDDIGSGSGSGNMEAISQINELMVQLAEMFKKLRNVMQEHNIKQQSLGWDVQVSAMKDKRESIDKAYKSSMMTGGMQLGAGLVGLVGSGAAGHYGLNKLNSEKSALASGLGSGFGKSMGGIGTMASAGLTKDAELAKARGNFKEQSAQNYIKVANELNDKAKQISEQMRSMIKDLVDLHGRISSAVHN
ncbi:hypothetical protein SVI_2252 [Shewanella violacea DSS12]|uniref:Pathogenicity island effector protein n=2 Tax=Shewanella violacea TaxID=60217 RepID=D4ZKM4_SHEVD|nr:hypothetical protein SVI_2252 [Shewanella violacea DSS12]